MKRLKILFTVLCMLCSAVVFAHDFEVDGIYYNITDATNKTVAVTYPGSSFTSVDNEYTGSVVIPENVNYYSTTYSVTSIGIYAFEDCRGLTSIEIPNSVTSIGEEAFYGCSGLTYVEIPNSVTSIGKSAFKYCSGLTSIVIPNSVTSISDEAFESCTGLKEVHINDLKAWCNIRFSKYNGNPLRYAHNLYLNGELLTELIIPDGIKSIETSAFVFCSSLTSIIIPNSVTSIGENAFFGCSGLTSIEIPNSVTSIGYMAFYGCSKVETLYISNAIESIGEDAFYKCDNIVEIKIGAEKPIKGSPYIFADAVYDNAILYIPSETESLYQKREPWTNFFHIQEIDFTGIDDIKETVVESNVIYDLSGRVVENPTNGIYIINGKKKINKVNQLH